MERKIYGSSKLKKTIKICAATIKILKRLNYNVFIKYKNKRIV